MSTTQAPLPTPEQLNSSLLCHYTIKPNAYIPPAPKFPVRQLSSNFVAGLANSTSQSAENVANAAIADEEFDAFLVTSVFGKGMLVNDDENASMMLLLARNASRIDMRMEVLQQDESGIATSSGTSDFTQKYDMEVFNDKLKEIRRKIHAAVFMGDAQSVHDGVSLAMAAPTAFSSTLKQQQILSVAQKLPEKRTFVMQELTLMSLRDDFNVLFTSTTSATKDTKPLSFLDFIYKTMLVDLNKLLTHPDAIRVVFQHGSSHHYFDYFYEITERVLLGLIALRNLASKPWNRAAMATEELMQVMDRVMEFVLTVCSEKHCSIINMNDLRARLIQVWLSKVMYVLKHVSMDLIFGAMDRRSVEKFLANLQDIFFLEEEAYGSLSLSVLEVMHLLTVVPRTEVAPPSTSSDDAANPEADRMEDSEENAAENTDSGATAEEQENEATTNGTEDTAAPSEQPTTPITNIQNDITSQLSSTRYVSVRHVAQQMRQHNLTYFQSAMDKIMPVLTELIVPTHVLIRNTTHIMCRAYVLHLLRRFASTDLVTLNFKNSIAATDNMVMRLVTVMPVQPRPRMYIENIPNSSVSARRIASLRNDDELQRCCAEIIVGFSETASAMRQLKQCSDKVTMICMLAPDEVAELMTNCLYSREVSLTVIGDTMEEEISDTIVEDTMEDFDE